MLIIPYPTGFEKIEKNDIPQSGQNVFVYVAKNSPEFPSKIPRIGQKPLTSLSKYAILNPPPPALVPRAAL
jgi:hypothetical protein